MGRKITRNYSVCNRPCYFLNLFHVPPCSAMIKYSPNNSPHIQLLGYKSWSGLIHLFPCSRRVLTSLDFLPVRPFSVPPCKWILRPNQPNCCLTTQHQPTEKAKSSQFLRFTTRHKLLHLLISLSKVSRPKKAGRRDHYAKLFLCLSTSFVCLHARLNNSCFSLFTLWFWWGVDWIGLRETQKVAHFTDGKRATAWRQQVKGLLVDGS